jgi:PAS domain S-box-containing protein
VVLRSTEQHISIDSCESRTDQARRAATRIWETRRPTGVVAAGPHIGQPADWGLIRPRIRSARRGRDTRDPRACGRYLRLRTRRRFDEETRVLLAQSDERVRLLCQTSLGALFIVDDARRYVRVNEPATMLLGASRGEILGRRIEHFTPPERCLRLEQLSAALRRKGSLEGEYEVLRGDGTRAWVRFRARYRFAAGEHLIAAVETARPDDFLALGGIPALTPREIEVLQLASDGHTTKQIAATLVVSRATVKTHFEHIYEKLDAHDRVSAVAKALRLSLIS